MIKNGVAILLFIFLISSCRSTKNIQTAMAKKDTVSAIVRTDENMKVDSQAIIRENYRQLLDNHIDFTTFSAKVDVDYEDMDGKKYDVNAHIRMYKDSVIWVSITAILGIEGLRAYITKDSVKVLDKQNKLYMIRSVSYLQEVTALPFNLVSLQDLLIGNPVFLDSNIISFSKTENSISLLSMGRLFKNLFTISDKDKLPQSSKLDDLNDQLNRTSYLSYSDYESKKGPNFSTSRLISVSEKKKLDIKLNFKQYAFNETLSFPFTIPKSYKPN